MTAQALFRLGAIAALLIAGAAGSASAADKSLPGSKRQVELSYAPLVKRAAPAVVNIYTKRVVEQRGLSPFFNDPFFRRFFGEQSPFGSRKRIQNSLGSGVIVKPDGLVVTNHHVIEKASKITVVLADRREFDATVVIKDERTDLAVLRIDTGGEALPFLRFRDSDELEVGDLVLAIGNPFGVGQTVTSGIVSALARTARGVSDFSFFIQTDAAINPGNSGGALISMDGSLIGINTAIYSKDGGSNGIGFAIPANMVATVVNSAKMGSRVLRPWFGASVQSMTAELAESLSLDRPLGAIVHETYRRGPADRAGLEQGDVIVAVNGREVQDATALSFRIGTLPIGSTATLSVIRAGRPLTLRLKLVRAPEDPPRNETVLRGEHPLSGARTANLSPALAEELSFDVMQTGVIVLKIRRGSPAHRVGLRPGDVIVSINTYRVDTVDDLKDVLRRPADSWRVVLRRDGKTLSFVVRA